MEEKILNARKNGMAVLLLTLLGYAASIALFVCSVLLLEDDRLLPGIPLLIELAVLAADFVHWLLDRRHFPVLRPEGTQAPGGAGTYPLWRLCGHPEGPGLLLGKPLLRRRQPCRRHPAEPERGRDQQGERRSRPAERQRPEQPARLKQRKQKDLPEDDDPEQLPAEDQRLSGAALTTGEYANLCYDKERGGYWKSVSEYLPVRYPGTGDLFAAVLTAGLMQGDSPAMSMDRATRYVEITVKTTFGYGADPREGVMLERTLGWLTQKELPRGYSTL